MAQEITEQELLNQLHWFFNSYNNKHIRTRREMLYEFEQKNSHPTKEQKEEFKKSIAQGRLEVDRFDNELKEIMQKAIKNWGLKKTKEFIDKHAWDFANYDISVGTRKMSDVKKDKIFSFLLGPINDKHRELYKKSVKNLKDKIGIDVERDSDYLLWFKKNNKEKQ